MHADVFRFLTDKPLKLPTTAQGALTSHLADDATSSATPVLAGVRAEEHGTDPGYLDLSPPDQAVMATIEQALAEGRMPAFNRIHIL